jgi:hypothetical protein
MPADVVQAGPSGHRMRRMAHAAVSREFVGSKSHQFACQVLGWPIRRYNLLVEGETDAAYLNLAIEMVRQVHGVDLSEQGELSIFPPGAGRDGGVFRLVDDASLILNMVKRECNSKFSEALAFVILLDSDEEGRRSAERLGQNQFKSGQFLLLHVNFPVEWQVTKWESQLKKLNPHKWDSECWIEELLSPDVHRDFIAMSIEDVRALVPDPPSETTPPPRVIRKEEKDYRAIPPRVRYEWEGYYKGHLVEFVRQRACVAELIKLIRLLYFIRSGWHLETDAIPELAD